MDMSHVLHLFQKNGARQTNKLSGEQGFRQPSAASNLLQQLSNQMIGKQESGAQVDAAKKTREMRMDAYEKTDSNQALEDMPEELLYVSLHISKLYANTADRQAQDLLDFKARLQGMDQTIQGYQDILDGKASPAESMIPVDIAKSLAQAKQERAQFIQDGGAHLNKWSDYFITDGSFDSHMKKVLGENKFEGRDGSNWRLDLDASDIYTEIDRALAQTSGVREELDRGIGRIYDILDQRGVGDKYKVYLESWRAESGSYFDQIEARPIQQVMIDNLMRAPLKEAQQLNSF